MRGYIGRVKSRRGKFKQRTVAKMAGSERILYKENAGRNVNKEGQEGLILNSGRFHISRGRGQRWERAEPRE